MKRTKSGKKGDWWGLIEIDRDWWGLVVIGGDWWRLVGMGG
jgi:hypothetical protein